MNIKHKIAAAACAGALAMAGVVPAFAADATADKTVNKSEGTQDVEISAAVAKDNEKIISVTLPSKMAVAITTDQATSKFSKADGSSATVTNNDVSTSAVKVEIAKVSQTAGLDSNKKLLDLVDLKLVGDEAAGIVLAEGDQTGKVLFASIADGGSSTLKLEAAAKASNPEIPTDAFTVNTTLKVTAL